MLAAAWSRILKAEPFIAGRIDEALIQSHWDDILRLAPSIRTGAAPASLMLRRLGSYPRQNGLALALREVSRIERTLFTLDCLEDPATTRSPVPFPSIASARAQLDRLLDPGNPSVAWTTLQRADKAVGRPLAASKKVQDHLPNLERIPTEKEA